MQVIEIEYSEYERMHEKLKGNIMVKMDSIGIWWTDTEEERLEKIEKAFNPPLPMFIDIHTEDGLIRYSPIKDKKRNGKIR